MLKIKEKTKSLWMFFKRWWRIFIAVVAIQVLEVAGMDFARYLLYNRPIFHDVTVELGTENINISEFMNKYTNREKAHIVTDLSTVDISMAGDTVLTLAYGDKEENVTLTVQDSTPPKVEFVARLEKKPDYQPDPNDFVISCFDLSDVTVYFEGNVVVPLDYRTQNVTVVVEDASGNITAGECEFSIRWMEDEYTMELGEVLTKKDILFNPERDASLIDQRDIDMINNTGIGDYTIVASKDKKNCQVHVADTTPPIVELRDISINVGEKVTVESFVEYCFDASGDVQTRLVTEPDNQNLGIQTITVEATDINGNVCTSTATMAVVLDKTPPKIKGLTTLTLAKRSLPPDYLSGVTAQDKEDGACEVFYDDRSVNLETAGTYYVTYTSKDKSGNVAREKRTVVVEHDKEDTKALADSIAEKLGSDPEAIRDYVRDNIKYNHNNGGDDPTWYGFTEWKGDCRVHAYCLQELLTRKGYETQLIWVTDKSHYWLIINLNGTWRHIDATPGTRHTKYSLMTDAERYSILQGRDWERSKWPACE